MIVDGRGDVRYVFSEVKEKVKEQAPARTVPKNPAQTPAAFTGAQLKQAVDEMNACKSRAQVLSVWKDTQSCRTITSFVTPVLKWAKNILKRNDKISKVPCGFQ